MTKEELEDLIHLYYEIMDYGVVEDAEELLKEFPELLGYVGEDE